MTSQKAAKIWIYVGYTAEFVGDTSFSNYTC